MSAPEAQVATPSGRSLGRSVARALRPHQWVKNGLVAVPLVLAHRVGDAEAVGAVALAFVAFSMAASGAYALNDVLDRERDRRHPTKRTRPFASGALSPAAGVAMSAGLVGGALGLSVLSLPAAFTGLLVAYVLATLAYSLSLKRVAVVDVLVLAGLYALRVLAGGAAAGVRVSEWLLAFSVFFFLALALLKRYAELRRIEAGEAPPDNGRGYEVGDARLLGSVGPACGLIAVLVFALYVTGPGVRELYARPALLWLAAPPLLYWTMRMWLVAHRGRMNDDPVLFAVTDPPSYAVAVLVAAVLAVASL